MHKAGIVLEREPYIWGAGGEGSRLIWGEIFSLRRLARERGGEENTEQIENKKRCQELLTRDHQEELFLLGTRQGGSVDQQTTGEGSR